MILEDLKPSILLLSQADVEYLHREVRKNRLKKKEVKKAKTKKTPTTKKAKAKAESRSMQKIMKDPNKVRELLRLLGEEV